MSIAGDRVNLSLRAALDLRWKRQEVLAHNLANAETPGFVPRDLEFEGVLQSVVEPTEVETLAGRGGDGGGARPLGVAEEQALIERAEIGDSLDQNGVDTDKEMARIADNSLHFQAQIEVLRRRYAAVQRAIASMSGT